MQIQPVTPTAIGSRIGNGATAGDILYVGAGGVLAQAAVTGLVKGTGSTYTFAVAGTDYLAPNGSGSALTGITESQVSGLTADLAARPQSAASATISGAWTFTTTTALLDATFAEGNLGGDGPHSLATFGVSTGSGGSPTIAAVFHRKSSSQSFFFGEDIDTGGTGFRGTGGTSVSGSVAGGTLLCFLQNTASNATANKARYGIAPHGGFTSTLTPYVEAYNSANDAGIRFATYNDTDGAVIVRLDCDPAGNIVLGRTLALATTATDGFAYLPTCAGTPTGVPTAKTGKVAMVYDTSSNHLWIYNGGWKSAAFA